MSEMNERPAGSTEIVIEEKRRVNGTGLSALIVVILSFIVPVIVAIVGVTMARDSSQGVGATVIATVFAIAVAAFVAVTLDVVGIIVGIVALFRKNRGKALGIVAIALGLIPIITVVLGATIFSTVLTNTIGQG